MFLLKTLPAWEIGGIWLLAIFLCLLAAAIATPSHWWRRPTALGVLGLAGVSFILAQGLLYALPSLHANTLNISNNTSPSIGLSTATARIITSAKPPSVLPDHPPTLSVPPSATPFRVHQALNLRQQAGTDAALITTLPAGSKVWLTGKRNGDWWQVRTAMHSGWVSSLWLRQAANKQTASTP